MRCLKYLSVAGIRIQIESAEALGENEEFSPFLTEECDADVCVTVRKVDCLPQKPHKVLYRDLFCSIGHNRNGDLQKFFAVNGNGAEPAIVSTYFPDGKHILVEHLPRQLDLQTCFYCLGFESILLSRNRISLHASCVDTRYGGILFSGVSGAGKSTQADLWQQYRGARPINGDRPILSRDGKLWQAWGSPYAGSSKVYVNDRCRVTAVVFPRKATTCSLRKLPAAEAFRRIWEGLTVRSWDAAFVDKASMLAMDLIASVPVYEFACTADQAAVAFLEEELRKELIL